MRGSMQPDRWTRIKDIFEEIADQPEYDRTGRLDQLCGGDASLRAEVESLLKGDTQAGEFMPKRVASIAPHVFGASEFEGRRFGAYQTTREIGRGGLGVVYLAERADEQFTNVSPLS
jgi:hypothetical protein